MLYNDRRNYTKSCVLSPPYRKIPHIYGYFLTPKIRVERFFTQYGIIALLDYSISAEVCQAFLRAYLIFLYNKIKNNRETGGFL